MSPYTIHVVHADEDGSGEGVVLFFSPFDLSAHFICTVSISLHGIISDFRKEIVIKETAVNGVKRKRKMNFYPPGNSIIPTIIMTVVCNYLLIISFIFQQYEVE